MFIFRNHDFFVSIVACTVISCIAVISSWIIFDGTTSIFVFFVCALFCALHIITTLRRYRSIAALSSELGSILHGNTLLDLSECSEGELAVLRSEIYKMTRRLREQSDALSEEKTFLSDSMADVSHQLRTPLTALNLSLTLLKSPDTSAERKSELLREISTLLSRVEWLVSAMLIMAKIDAGTAKFQCKPVPVSQLISRAYAPLEISMELKSQTFTIDMSGDESFLGDMDWSVEAVGNILKNAMEHTDVGGEIHVACIENALFTEIIVSDNGSGIDEADLPNLFKRFYKGKGSPDGSVGVGLALAQMIVTEQNGSIKAQNSPYGGARFIIRFHKAIV